MEEVDAAFTQLKKVLSTPPVLVAPKEKEPLLLYIAATHPVLSTVLVVERSEEGKAHGVQRPVYFISKVLSPTAKVSALSKASIQCFHNSSKTTAILCGAPNHSSQRSTTLEHIEQPFGNRTCLLMGN
jgi:hypothetical protein